MCGVLFRDFEVLFCMIWIPISIELNQTLFWHTILPWHFLITSFSLHFKIMLLTLALKHTSILYIVELEKKKKLKWVCPGKFFFQNLVYFLK